MTNNYRFRCPVKIVSGRTALDKLPDELFQLGGHRPIIITDSGIAKSGILATVLDVFEGTDIEPGAVYDQVPLDSPLSSVLEIVEQYHMQGCDSFVVLGGGSAIDTAKAANMKASLAGLDLMNFKEVLRARVDTRPLIAIPTTAGTGSEVTSAAVISNPEEGIKLSLINPSIPPDTAIIDPRMTATLPPRLTAATGMDALTHAIEAYLGIQKNPISDALAISAIDIIGQNLVEAVRDGQNLDVRLAMANAATIAGMAFSNSMVGMVHALGHASGAVCHLPHGEAMSLFLPDTLEFNMDTVGPELAELMVVLTGAENGAKTPPEKRAGIFIEMLRHIREQLNGLCGLPLTLKEAGVTADKLEEIAAVSLEDGAAFYNRKKFNQQDALLVLSKLAD